jgi:hypothetical protein
MRRARWESLERSVKEAEKALRERQEAVREGGHSCRLAAVFSSEASNGATIE